MKATRVIASTLLATFCAACGHEPAEQPAEPPAVRVAPVERGTLSEWLRLSGRVVPLPDHDATLSPRVDGILAEVTAHLGERVSRGRVLARVDTSALVDALIAADAAEKSAAADADAKRRVATHTRTLFERGVVSGEQAEADEAAATAAQAVSAQAQAARALASRRRSWAELRAPFEGVVTRVLRQAGEPVDGTAATPVIEIAAEHPVQVALDATAAVLSRLSEGQTAEIIVDTPDAAPIPARVLGVAHSVDSATGTGPVRLGPSTDDAPLLLGRVVEARIAVARREGVLVVPAAALRGGADGAVEAVVVKDHRSHVATVVTGIHDGDRVEIVSGLAEGDVIVVDDPDGLGDDAPVRDGP
jgi:RND family efflux transporter MFP subunit